MLEDEQVVWGATTDDEGCNFLKLAHVFGVSVVSYIPDRKANPFHEPTFVRNPAYISLLWTWCWLWNYAMTGADTICGIARRWKGFHRLHEL